MRVCSIPCAQGETERKSAKNVRKAYLIPEGYVLECLFYDRLTVVKSALPITKYTACMVSVPSMVSINRRDCPPVAPLWHARHASCVFC